MPKKFYDNQSFEGERHRLLEQWSRAISDLPSEIAERRYLTFFNTPVPRTTSRKSDEPFPLSDQAVQEIVDVLDSQVGLVPSIASEKEAAATIADFFDPNNESHAVRSEVLWRWAQKNPEEHIPCLQKMIARHIDLLSHFLCKIRF